jgi:hypothetical protein
MTAIEVTPPANGRVVLDLSWDDAEILLRALGMTNTGSMESVSPNLVSVVGELVKEFGRNNDIEARKYRATVLKSQVYIEEK